VLAGIPPSQDPPPHRRRQVPPLATCPPLAAWPCIAAVAVASAAAAPAAAAAAAPAAARVEFKLEVQGGGGGAEAGQRPQRLLRRQSRPLVVVSASSKGGVSHLHQGVRLGQLHQGPHRAETAGAPGLPPIGAAAKRRSGEEAKRRRGEGWRRSGILLQVDTSAVTLRSVSVTN
jgi:hypothetical protein